jgi:hypothetical protein
MSYINVGAYVNGVRPKSKKALRDALAAGADVEFDSTAAFGPRAGETIYATHNDIKADTLQVVGPDPYEKRDWYASVFVKAGKIVVR